MTIHDTDPDKFSAEHQYARALHCLESRADYGDHVTLADELAEANVHATLALAAYTRDLTQAFRAFAADPRVPVSELAELIGDVLRIASGQPA